MVFDFCVLLCRVICDSDGFATWDGYGSTIGVRNVTRRGERIDRCANIGDAFAGVFVWLFGADLLYRNQTIEGRIDSGTAERNQT